MISINFNNFFKTLLLILIAFTLHGCDSILFNPHGIIAIQECSILLISFLIMLFVIIPVIFMTIYFSVKYRASNINAKYKPDWCDSKKIEIIVWTIPISIILFLAFVTWNYSHILDPKKSIISKYKPIKIDVVSLDWRWLFIYPEYHIATINEIMFPINRSIIFHITSNSVMNSFFIPSLGSQIYAMPGMMTTLNLMSNSPGKYKGISSNYSGKGFSNMKFTAISVLNIKDFENWIKKAQQSPKKLNKMSIFNIISLPNENHFIEYFSDVKKNLFYEIINQTYSKNKVFKH
ncbi:ubiquinol oxidase subunit II [Buchnera aphidicola]|uniref:Cytochrome bo(3) ubiquinol oxidase subunit 2 n=1 Tax=Buchnera aphidicola subsp. Schizaphis graminum (strain Sg) TaxID=198804 RepID=CYOA_BUCAP|nr:ubiquinol oxidase subunit II [Buchnera aphidicola]Q8K993.1 RecName: Full=Cytochrome bo(3) ubiquinol oxidase subunit 2; AltName: Full=Cytochrome o ubiquinol oxidase subunit 2; Short=Cytochrome o subunit 2; AltName: Full=Oxidase bo(3) subunit 2; AltName: Full=Ubiquinol oxidase polypeptide II; AltName: Full=Ubiquinol oxidase subunit 2; Flags: Precursor [Buchnera aphidicola str. Sg (Schizaphis graminum)]AAM67999.1 cytochrome o ubiquinol oxidase A [Buchnera aphidicola str. Sg (Schizaphis graminum)]